MTARIRKCLRVTFLGIALLAGCGVAYLADGLVFDRTLFGVTRSDPPNDFKRFVMGGPHWADEDQHYGYNPNAVALPKSVRDLRSITFTNEWWGEGAVLNFQIDHKDLDGIIAEDEFEPVSDANEKERLDSWSRPYLGVSSDALGPAPALYMTKDSPHRTLMAVNRDSTRAIFLYVNSN